MRSAYGRVLIVALASRLLVLVTILLFSQLAVVKESYGGRVKETRIVLSAPGEALLREAFVVGDAEWFRSIAQDGYSRAPLTPSVQTNRAFFPGWPLLWRLFARAGLALSGVLLANLLFTAGAMAVYAAGLRATGSEDASFHAVLLLCAFPTSYFFSLPVSESLFLVASASAFLAAFERRWALASMAAAVASATRPMGVLVAVALFLVHHELERRWLGKGVAWLLAAPAGLVGFALFLYLTTGDFLAFATTQTAWQRGGSIVEAIRHAEPWTVVSFEWNFRLLHLASVLLLLAAGAYLIRMRQYGFAVLVLGSLALALSSLSLQSMTRYVLSAWPCFIAFGQWSAGRRTAGLVAIGIATFLLGLMTLLFALHYDIGMA